jgi:hypothetical protein
MNVGASRTHRRRAIGGWVIALVAAAATPPVSSSAQPAPEAVWLWAGVPPSQVPDGTRIVYLYQGELVERAGAVEVVRRGLHPIGGDTRAIVPAVRFRGQPAPETVARHFEALAAAWEARGRSVPMVQIDWDVPSRRVGAHADFVAGVRAALDRRYALSVTGLADWIVAAPRADLLRLAGAADEIVFQLYHERHEVPGIARYDAALAAFERPFKVGLLPGMALPPRASRSVNWRGSVTFLLKERTVRDASTGPGESVPVVPPDPGFGQALRALSLRPAWLR